jgi:hypothetical protein
MWRGPLLPALAPLFDGRGRDTHGQECPGHIASAGARSTKETGREARLPIGTYFVCGTVTCTWVCAVLPDESEPVYVIV